MATRKDSIDWEDVRDKSAEVARAAAKTGWKWTKKFLKKSAQVTTDSALLAKPLTKRQKFKLSKVNPYLHKNELNKLTMLLKQGKANIELKRFGWSFLISGRDLLPVLEYIHPDNRKFIFDKSKERSDKNFIKEAEQKIQKAFYRIAFDDFAERAWGAIPQYISPTLVTPVFVKQAIALQLFCPRKFKILLKGGKAKKKLLASASDIDNNLVAADLDELADKQRKVLSSKKLLAGSRNKTLQGNFNLTLTVKKINLKKFTDLVESLVVQEVKINKNDIFFIKKYVKMGQKINVRIPPRFVEKIKSFALTLDKRKINKNTVEGILQLVKASAAMELRSEIKTKDLVRIFEIFRKAYSS